MIEVWIESEVIEELILNPNPNRYTHTHIYIYTQIDSLSTIFYTEQAILAVTGFAKLFVLFVCIVVL